MRRALLALVFLAFAGAGHAQTPGGAPGQIGGGNITLSGSARQWFSLDQSTYDPNASTLTSGCNTFAGINLPGSARNDTLCHLGISYNLSNSSRRVNTSDVAYGWVGENFYLQGGVGVPASEMYYEYITTAGVVIRPISMYLPRDGGTGSNMAFASDVYFMEKYDSTLKIKFDLSLATPAVTLFDNTFIVGNNNNVPVWKQENAAGNAVLSGPYFNANDNLQLTTNMYQVGAIATTPAAVRAFHYMNITGTGAGGDRGISMAGTGMSYAGDFISLFSSGAFSNSYNYTQIANSASNGRAMYWANTTGTGNALFFWSTSQGRVTAGMDREGDSSNFKIGTGFEGFGAAATNFLYGRISDAHVGLGGVDATATYNVTTGTAGVTAVSHIGSAPTLSGTCSTTTQVGGNTAGSFVTSAGCSATTVIITFSLTAPNGWYCAAQDETTSADTLKQTAHSTTSCTLTGTTAASDVIVFHADAF